MKKLLYITLCFCLATNLFAQENADINQLIGALLGETPIEEDLQELCDQYGGRVTGTEANANAVNWGLQKFIEAGVAAQKEPFKIASLWVENSTIATVSGAANFYPKSSS